jgi:hypothetical protein
MIDAATSKTLVITAISGKYRVSLPESVSAHAVFATVQGVKTPIAIEVK